MKHLILIFALLATGCATVDHNGDTANEAAVRAYITTELYRIKDKRALIDDMLEQGKISNYEHFVLDEKCDEEKRTIIDRMPKHLMGY